MKKWLWGMFDDIFLKDQVFYLEIVYYKYGKANCYCVSY